MFLSGPNHLDWAVAYFGILRAGAVVVPLDPGLEPAQAAAIAETTQGHAALLADEEEVRLGASLGVAVHVLAEITAPGRVGTLPEAVVQPDDVASILFTSGTTGNPKGVMLTHGNFTSLLGALGRVFEIGTEDRVLSVLPLHHTFEFTCGLLLPLSMGARILYLDELTADRLSFGLKEGRITCMVGVPALWQVLERRVRSQVKGKGPLVEFAFGQMMDLNRSVGRATGLDLGRLMFGSVHSRFGGNIRVLISGGAALPKGTQKLFSGLGLHLSEGYGLTEASPVLTVSMPKPGAKTGTVGKAVPGVDVKILSTRNASRGRILSAGRIWGNGPI